MNHSKYKKKYSVYIYNGGFKGKWSRLSKDEKDEMLKKKWYVYWSYRDPETGKMKRQQNIHGPTNSYKTHKERMVILRGLKFDLEQNLANGVNPFNVKTDVDGTNTSFEAIDYALGIKKNHMKHSSFIRFKSDINKFKDYLKRNGYERRSISSIDKKTVTNYLNEVLESVSARSRNNYKTSIRTVWQTLKDEGVVNENFVSSIPLLNSVPQRNRIYTDNQVNDIFEYLGKTDPDLLLYIKFISFNFLRNIEVSRLRVEDISIKEKTLSVMVKQGYRKTKIIPDILLEDLPNMEGKTGFIFGRTGLFQEWDVSEDRRRAVYGNRYTNVKKHFNLSNDYTLYSYRHFSISKLFNYYRKDLSITQTYDKLMLVTGHTSLKGLQNYLRSIDVDKPEDYSDGLV